MSSQLLRLLAKGWTSLASPPKTPPGPVLCGNGIFPTMQPDRDKIHDIAIIYLSSSSSADNQKLMSYSSYNSLLMLWSIRFCPPSKPARILWTPCTLYVKCCSLSISDCGVDGDIHYFCLLVQWMDLLPYRLGFIYKINTASSLQICRQGLQDYQWQRSIHRPKMKKDEKLGNWTSKEVLY